MVKMRLRVGYIDGLWDQVPLFLRALWWYFPPKMIQKNIPKKNDISFCLLPQMQMPQIPIKELAVLYPLHQGPVVKNGSIYPDGTHHPPLRLQGGGLRASERATLRRSACASAAEGYMAMDQYL